MVRSNAAAFANMHVRGNPLVLPNAWDAASARIFEDAGFPAIATTSAGMANALGYADGEAVDPHEMIAAIARVARVIKVPLTADIEAGYAAGIDGLLRGIQAVIAAGAVGINLEDWDVNGDALMPLDVARERVAAVAARFGDAVFINARTDVYLHDVGEAATRFDATLERLRAYVAAGAGGVFVPGISDAETIGAVAGAIDAPLNVLAGPATPPVAELARLGVARVSVGSAPMRRIMGETRLIARELRDHGTFEFSRGDRPMSYADANALFKPAT